MLLVTTLMGVSPLPAQEVTGDQVKRAIRRGTTYLAGVQGADGHWTMMHQPGGTTALSVFAMLTAGVPRDDPHIRAGLAAVQNTANLHTYTVALKIMALATADPRAYARDIQVAADWLVKTQLSAGTWSYGQRMGAFGGMGDHSNTQYALLGLYEASRAGAQIPPRVWEIAERHWMLTQMKDGGWGYSPTAQGPATGSMTTAGLASLYIVGNSVVTRREKGFTKEGKAPHCGQYANHTALMAGLNWLTLRFSVRENPGSHSWPYYYLYGLERVGMLIGLSRFGGHDWYREGAGFLVQQQRGDGSWGDSIVDTSFALLFLGKGHRSLLVNKLRWSRNTDWTPDRNDAAHLTTWLGNQLGEPVTWQVVDWDAPMEQWLEAPILYFTGHSFPRFTKDTAEKLRRFVENGGVILAEACCGSKAFVDGMRAFAEDVFGEFPLRPLEPEHPIYHAAYDLNVEDFEIEGIDLGCRTSILFSPRDLSCLWEQMNIPVLSEQALRMGANIAAYATGREPLRDRLARVRLPEANPTQRREVRSGLQIGQVVHNGDWRPDPHAMVNLAILLNERANVDVMTQAQPIRLEEDGVFDYPILYMVGHYDFSLTPAQGENLKRFLQRGGFLFAEACCGRKAFDTAFRRTMARLFGDASLKRLPTDHAILSGAVGYGISRVTYRPAVQREQPALNAPTLEGIELAGRTAVVYSPFGIGCGLEGHQCHHCRGYVEEDARRVAVNVLLYALSY